MASFEFPNEYGFDDPPPRPTTPPVRRGFLLVLLVLSLLASLVYGVPYVAERAGYAYEAGRGRAASESLAKLDAAGVVNRASVLFRTATAAVAPAVVNVSSHHAVPKGRGRLEMGGPRGDGSMFDLGSGVVIDKARGYIVTNHHVVKDADGITVKLSRGLEMTAKLVGADPQTDLAVVQVRGPLPFEARWGDSTKLEVGDWVLAIGSPFALDRTVTSGIVSATGRSDLKIVGESSYEDFIQTDAAINPGNSGGPLIDLRGQVIGINTAILSESGGYQGIGLAISSALARRVVEQLIENGRVSRGYLGVVMEAVDAKMADQLGLDEPGGILIKDIDPESPAARAGLEAGDVLVGLADEPIADMLEFRNKIASTPTGTEVGLAYVRDGARRSARVTIGELPVLAAMGLHVREDPAGGPDGQPAMVIAQVLEGSQADRLGLRPSMRILEIDGHPVRTRAEYDAASQQADPARGIPLVVQLPDGRAGPVILGGPRP